MVIFREKQVDVYRIDGPGEAGSAEEILRYA